jgi:hypothetical protein
MLRAREATRWALVWLQDLHDPGGNVFCSYFPYNAKLCINGHESGLHLSQWIFRWQAISKCCAKSSANELRE